MFKQIIIKTTSTKLLVNRSTNNCLNDWCLLDSFGHFSLFTICSRQFVSIIDTWWKWTFVDNPGRRRDINRGLHIVKTLFTTFYCVFIVWQPMYLNENCINTSKHNKFWQNFYKYLLGLFVSKVSFWNMSRLVFVIFNTVNNNWYLHPGGE